jgi:hypothetical protein
MDIWIKDSAVALVVGVDLSVAAMIISIVASVWSDVRQFNN